MSATLPHKSTRLPGAEPPRGGQKVLGVVALLGTIAIVVGVPVALLTVFGRPWPDERPSLEWLTTPTTTETVMAVLAAVVWLAWLHFVICLAVEAFAAVRRRGIAPSIPGGGLGTQALARNLVLTIMVLVGVTAVSVTPANAATDSSTGGSTASVATASSDPGSARGGIGRHAAATSAGTSAPNLDGVQGRRVLPTPAALDDARRADVAAGVATYYSVQPPEGRNYDTLWDIAERYLGNGLRYKEIVELNRGLKQPDGTELQDPDLIYPGWILRLPADAQGPGLKVVDHADPHAGGGGKGGGDATGVVLGTGAERASEAAGGTDIGSVVDSAVETVVESQWAPVFGAAGALALGGAFLGLRRRRAAMPVGQLWAMSGMSGTPTGPGPDGPGGPGGGPGARLRDEANPALAEWLDRALRGSGVGTLAPAPTSVSVGATGLAMAFSESVSSAPPAGWTGVSERVWALGAGAVPRGGGPAPVPGLVTIGRRDDDSLLLVDPEGVTGLISLEGPDEVARGLAISMAVDTATHPWADQRTVTMVGFADDITAVGGGNLRRTHDLGSVLTELEALARQHRGACRHLGVRSAREARLRGATATYQLVVCSGLPSLTDLSRLQSLASDPEVALGVVVVGSLPSAEMRLVGQPDGRLVSPLHGIDVRAQVLDVAAARALADIYQAPPGQGVTFQEWVGAVAGAAPALTPDVTVRVRILGPVEVDAPGAVEPERVEFLTEMACYLALHPQGVHVNRLTGALWPRGADPQSRDAALRQLGEWLGTSGGRPVLHEEAGVWSLRPGAVRLDWDDFRRDLDQAATSGSDGEVLLRRALSHLRGLPFAEAPVGRYSWLETMTLEAEVMVAMALTTLAAAEAAADRDDPATARAVLARGLGLMPANEDLWRSRLRLEARFGGRDQVAPVADAMYVALADHGYGASGETDALVAELAPGYRRQVA